MKGVASAAELAASIVAPLPPSVGRIVHYHPNKHDQDARSNDNPGPVAAIVTRTWGSSTADFPDYGHPASRTSVPHWTNAKAAYERSVEMLGEDQAVMGLAGDGQVSRQTVTTTVKEYDEEGRLVKETVTTSEYDWAETPGLPQYPYVQPSPWTYPTITWGPNTAQGIYTATPNTWTVINGEGDGGEAVTA